MNDNFTAMAVIIDKKNQKEAHRILPGKMKKNRKEGKLAKHFGKLRRNIDGLKYQLTMRENED